MWSHGSRRSGRTSWEDFNDRDRRTVATGVPREARDRLQRDRRPAPGRTDRALHPLAHHARAPAGIRVVALARRSRPVPGGPDAFRHLSEPRGERVGRRDRDDRVLGASSRGREVPGVRDQLRAPRMPRPLVPAIELVHVPVSRWRLLCGRLARLRTAGAWLVRISLQDRSGKSLHQSRRDPHARARRCRRRGEAVVRLIESVSDWLDQRLQLATSIRATMAHPVPRETASWFYVFGSAALTVFVLQIVTGILLALVYVPSAGEAWSSLQILNHDVSLGWFIRAVHGWGSNFMIAVVLIHMVQVFLFGAHKYPRELTWIVGVLLLLMTLGMAFTGQVLRFDQDAYWGLGIGVSIASRVPVMGPWLVNLLLGGPIIAGATLSRFFALHVFVIPGLLIAFVGVHLLMVLKLGINEWPMPGRIVRCATYMQEYHELTHKQGVPFVPGAVGKDIVFSGFILLAIAACALYFGPFGPGGQPDPTIIQTAPHPDFFFLWLYALLSFCPRQR